MVAAPPPVAPPDPRTLLSAGAAAVAQVPQRVLSFIETEQSQAWRVRVVVADGTEQQMDIDSGGTTVLVGPTPRNNSDADTAARRLGWWPRTWTIGPPSKKYLRLCAADPSLT